MLDSPLIIVRSIFTYFWRQVVWGTDARPSQLHSAGGSGQQVRWGGNPSNSIPFQNSCNTKVSQFHSTRSSEEDVLGEEERKVDGGNGD